MHKLTEDDIDHIDQTLKELHDPDGCEGCSDCSTAAEMADKDCFDSETVMLSIGYAEVHADGRVVSSGVVIHEHPVPGKNNE